MSFNHFQLNIRDYLRFIMEYSHRRNKTQTFPIRRSSTRIRSDQIQEIPSLNLQAHKQKTQKTRPTTTRTKKSAFFKRIVTTPQCKKNTSSSFYQDPLEFIELLKKTEIPKVRRQFRLEKKLTLCERQQVLKEDVYKLQNLITGAYSCQDDFMSLSKFNRAKDNFILLDEVYEKAKGIVKSGGNLKKQRIKERNIFSIIYLNENLDRMGGGNRVNKLCRSQKL